MTKLIKHLYGKPKHKRDKYITYFEFTRSSIRKYVRSKMLLLLGQRMWLIYESNLTRKSPPKPVDKLAFGYSSRIFSLIVANGSDFQRKIPDSNAVYELCDDYFQLKNSITDFEFTEVERKEVLLRLRSSKDFDHKIEETDAVAIQLQMAISRLHRAQWNSEQGHVNDCLRSWGIFQFFKFRIQDKLPVDFVVKKIFNLSESDFLRAILCIYLELSRKKSTDLFKSVIKVSAIQIDPNLEREYQITHETIHLCISRLLGTVGEYKEWFFNNGKLNPYYAMHSVSPIFRKPILKIKSFDANFSFEEDSYIVPSPALLFRGVSKSFFMLTEENEKLFQQYAHDEKLTINVKTIYGDAIDDYFLNLLKMKLPQNTFERVVPQKVGKKEESAADFVLETNSFQVFVEIKKSMSNIESTNMLLPEDILKYWDRLAGCCEQLASTLNKSKSEKIKIAIICYEECYSLDTSTYLATNQKNGNFAALGLKYVEVFSYEMFEQFIFANESEKEVILKKIIKCWDDFLTHDFDYRYFSPIKDVDFPIEKYIEHYDQIYLSLFPI